MIAAESGSGNVPGETNRYRHDLSPGKGRDTVAPDTVLPYHGYHSRAGVRRDDFEPIEGTMRAKTRWIGGLAALAGLVLAADAPTSALRTAAEGINADALLGHIKVLASDSFEGRGPGTPGEEKTVAYLTEREGTTCENLPATHAILKTLRRHIDERCLGALVVHLAQPGIYIAAQVIQHMMRITVQPLRFAANAAGGNGEW